MSLCKCTSPECGERRNQCYRFRKPDTGWQAFSPMYEPHPSDPSIKCINFVAIEGRTNLHPIEESKNE